MNYRQALQAHQVGQAAPPVPPLPTLSTWVPYLHGLVAAALGAVGYFARGTMPGWAEPALMLAGGVVFVVGTWLYIDHKNHWNASATNGADHWMVGQWSELRAMLVDVADELPPGLAERLQHLESEALARLDVGGLVTAALRPPDGPRSPEAPRTSQTPPSALPGPEPSRQAPLLPIASLP